MIGEAVLTAVGSVFLLVGCALATIGLYGMIRKPDIFDQLHVAALITGPGAVLVLLGSIATLHPESISSAILVIGFVLVTSSISTHVIAQAAARRYQPREMTPTRGWSATSAATTTPARAAAPVAGAEGEDHRLHGLRVVIAHDGSPGAKVATDLSAAIDWPPGTVVRLVSVVLDELPPIDGWQHDDRAPASLRTATGFEEALDETTRMLEERGVRVERVVLTGEPTDVIVVEAAAFAADLLITGVRRRGFLESLLSGSVSRGIVERAPCPVLVARSTRLAEVILTTDGSPPSTAAAELVARWPIFDLARIRVVTVGPAGTPERRRLPTPLLATPEQRQVDVTAALLMDAGREVATEVLHGAPAEQIVEAARRRDADLIVIGTRGRTGLSRVLLGSLAADLLDAAPCSVLIVPPPVRRPDLGG